MQRMLSPLLSLLNRISIFHALLSVTIAYAFLVSCAEVREQPTEPILTSFEIEKSLNKQIKNNIKFEKVGDSNVFLASYLSWVDSDMPDSFIPSFTFEGEKVTINGLEVISGESSISFAEDVICSVYNKGEKRDYVLSFICPQINTGLPVLRIDLDDKDIKDEYQYLEAKMLLYDPATKDTWWDYDSDKVSIRGRGNSTWVLPKKPYRIKFPKKISPLGESTIEAKNWALLAHDMDKSLIRNHLGFTIARKLTEIDGSSSFVPCSHFINVYFDNEYHGLYQLTDHIERDKGRVDIEKLDVKTGDSPDVISGGYMLETVINIDDPAIHFTTPHGYGIDHKYPKDDDHLDSQYKYIEDYVAEAESCLYSDAFDDPTYGWRKYFDEKSLVDYVIIKELAGDMDGYVSTRLYKKRGDDRLYFGPVWDMDKGWGNDNRTPFPEFPPSSSLMIHGGFRMNAANTTDWFCRFWEDDSFRSAVITRWNQVKALLMDEVLREIDNCEKGMSKSILANYEVWPFNYQASEFASTPANDYSGELDKMRQMTRDRANLLDELFK